MDEARIRAEAEAKVKAEYEDKYRREQETRRLNEALNQAKTAAESEPRPGAQVNAALRPRDTNARVYGTVLAAEMLAGLSGQGLADDGYGDGTGVHPDAA